MKNAEKNGLPEMYKYFKGKPKKYDKVIDYTTFAKVVKEFNKEVVRLMIEEGAEFKMPDRLGSLRIKKYKGKITFNEDGSIKKKRLAVNWKETWELWDKEYPGILRTHMKEIPNKPLVYHLNEHSDGYRFFPYWNKKGSNADNRKVYSFVFTSVNNRLLAAVVKGDNKPDYYE